MGTKYRQTVLGSMHWVAVPPLVIAALVAAGIVGVLAASLANVWEETVAGFLCTAAVVLTAYFSTPKFKLAAATIVMLSGAVLAWYWLSPPSLIPKYNPNTGITTGIPTYQSIIFTYVGGALSWVFCFLLARNSRRHQARNT